MPGVVLITNDSVHGQRVLHTVRQRGIVLDAVLYLTGSLGMPAPRAGRGLGDRVLRWPRFAASAVKRRVVFHRRRKASYAALCARVIGTGGMNSRRLLRDLRALAPDWIILGGGGILRPEVIETARLGVLNVHPALLPWIRGCGITGASLEHGVALGATLHRVDREIDTGAVVERRLVAAGPGDTHLGDLELACHQLAAEMMADAVEGIVRRGETPAGVPQTVRYPLFRWPDDVGMRRHHALAAAGRAHALYEAWRPLCADAARGILPPGPIDPPPTLTLEPVATSAR
ncbi:MAG TPA: formyltransferase family protein [Longimicrobium sp.]|nr:formyltransferase family protein [Longimicrobium sp.]